MTKRTRRGFALVATLWTIVGATALAFAATATGRITLHASHNRVEQIRARWLAAGCLATARYTLAALLWPDGGNAHSTRTHWNALDGFFSATPAARHPACTFTMEPAGVRADVNTLDRDALNRLITAAGMTSPLSDSLTDALLDWRDADHVPRPYGAERDWYRARHLAPPRNGPFVSAMELRWVRGFDAMPHLSRYLGTDADRVLWTRAPLPVLASLPGMAPEALQVFTTRRATITDIAAIGAFPEMPAAARAGIERAGPMLRQRTVSEPEAWDLDVTAGSGSPGMTVTLSVRLTLARDGLRITSHQVLP